MDRFRNTRQPDWDWWGRLWPTPGATLRELGVRPGASLVEVGSGNGYFALPAARITDPAPVYAVDVDESLLDELATLADTQRIDNVVPVAGDARALSNHLDAPVDACLVANTFHGVEEPASFVAEVIEVLADDGEFVVVNWVDQPRETTTVGGQARGPPTELRMSPPETRRVVEEAAPVTPTRQVELPPHHYAVVFERDG